LRFDDGVVPELLLADEDDETASSSSNDSSAKSEPKQSATGAYVWSDDDEDSDVPSPIEDPEHAAAAPSSKTGRVQQRINDPNKPDAASESSEIEASESNVGVAEFGSEVDLQSDVETNLRVLAQLFPGVDTKPRKLGTTEKQATQDGWGATGQMLRYDPAEPSAERFVMTEKAKAEAESPPSSESSHEEYKAEAQEKTDSQSACEGPKEDQDGGDDAANRLLSHDFGTQTGDAEREDIYHQRKLEQVFREAREDQAPAEEESRNEKCFMFSFNLGADTGNGLGGSDGIDSRLDSGFDFPVNTGKEVNENVEGRKSEHNVPEGSCRKRRRGPIFSDEELDKYVEDFFGYNNGDHILRDLEGFRNDESLKEEWMKERAALTKDWKRKQKHALSRSQAKRFR
jgi:hypothetical protein